MRELLAVEFVLPVLIALLLLTMRDSLLLGVISLITSLTSLTASLILLFEVIHVGPVNVELVSEWLRLPYIKPIDISFTLDPLSGLVSSLVCGLTALILTYSISYMRMDGKYSDTRRYWILMLVFMASMLVVINSDNFILMFVGWEGMSLCSYLLIGYYYGDEREYWIGGPPNKAPLYRPSYSSFITFLIVGCADALMLLGILMLVTLVGSPYYEDLAIMLAGRGIPEWLVILSLLLFLIGPMSKSAQFPLHVWLPYAMAGPTPVSALLHSATMVKAGVYIILRLLPHLTAITQTYSNVLIIFYILILSGVISMIGGAVNAGRGVELKRILAYSTISQIGLMFVILGVAGFMEMPLIAGTATMYHLISHALSKSALFLVAGVLIHVTGTLYIDEMRVYLKDFRHLFVIALISSLSLIGVPPLIGFWSKEFLIEVIVGNGYYTLFLAIIIGNFLTAFYMTRMLIITFSTSSNVLHEHHAVSRLMYYPPLLLALTSLIIGVIGFDVKGYLIRLVTVIEEIHMVHDNSILIGSTITAIFSGVLLAVLVYEQRLLHISPILAEITSRPRFREMVSTRRLWEVSTEMVVKLKSVRQFLLLQAPRSKKAFLIIKNSLRRQQVIVRGAGKGFIEVISTGVNYLLDLVRAFLSAKAFFKRHQISIKVVGVRVGEAVFTGVNYLFSLVFGSIGRFFLKHLTLLLNAVGSADMDTFLTTYVITLAILLIYILAITIG